MTGPCEWPTSFVACTNTAAIDGLTPEERELVEQMAIDLLWHWTGRVYGACPVTVRPCRQNCAAPLWGPQRHQWVPVLYSGRWYNVTCGKCGEWCSCTGFTPTIKLGAPVVSVEEVLIDGVALDPTAYRLDNWSLLTRIDGEQWPICQDLTADVTEPGSWAISYLYGQEVPVGGQVAAGLLANELAKALCNDNTCQLPQRVQSITRQGITVTLLDQFEDVEQGRTGIWLVDAWVASVTKPKRGGRVYSVDVAQPRYSTP